jgi:SAM-dependent methyltransferase
MSDLTRQQKDIAYHAAIAAEYDRVVVEPRSVIAKVLFAQFEPLINQTAQQRMLDIGCGTGHMVHRYGDRFPVVYAIDHSLEMIEVARATLSARLSAKTRFFNEDIRSFFNAHDEDRFDLITSVGCLHHLSAEEQSLTLSWVASHLSPNGIAVLADPIDLGVAVSVPEEIQSWNDRSPIAATSYSENVNAVDPDEAPIPIRAYLELIDRAGLQVVSKVQTWEIFSHSLTPTTQETEEITRLVNAYPNSGNVIAFALRSK